MEFFIASLITHERVITTATVPLGVNMALCTLAPDTSTTLWHAVGTDSGFLATCGARNHRLVETWFEKVKSKGQKKPAMFQ
jgi:hypothetical protein